MTEHGHPAPTLAETVAARRRGLKMTQVELAARAGVSHRTIQHIEAGTTRPVPAVLAMVARALELDEGELRAVAGSETAKAS